MKSLQSQLAEVLTEYGDEIREDVVDIVNQIAKQTARDLQAASPRNTGNYAKGWTVKKAERAWYGVEATIYNKNKPGLAHLLNDGHALRGGGRVSGDGHIDTVETSAQEKLYDEVVKKL